MNLTVLTAPLFSPDLARTSHELPAGHTVAEIVSTALPALVEPDLDQLRVTLVGETGTAVVPRAHWHRVRPRAGIRVVLRLVPAGNTLRSVLLAVVSIAAIALGQFWAPAVAGALGIGAPLAGALVTAGLTVVGQLLVNALIPPKSPGARRSSYAITGWRNEVRAGEPLPFVLGRHRYAPPFAATSYSEIVGDTQYVRALFTFGPGPVAISDIRLGDTPLSEFDEVEVETREGRDSDNPVSLYPRQILEDPANAELFRPLPRDDAGELTGGDAVETPVVRFTAAQAIKASVIIGFPSGLFRVDGDGNVQGQTVAVRIRQRPEGGTGWADVTTLDIVAEKREAFFRQYSWTLPTRGRWEIEVTRMTDETTSTQISDRTVLAALQSIRPEYPIASDTPLALVALRIKATHQLTGALDQVNALVQRYAPVWEGEAWVEGLPRNPASAFLVVLQGGGNPFPVADAEIDFELVADWFAFCAAKGLKYDRVHDQEESLRDVLTAICAAGRAAPRHDGLKWGVVIDRPDAIAVDHISPRNSANFSWTRSYLEPPDGMRVTFLDETNDYEPAERIVPWPGHTGLIELTEALDLPGKTDPDEIAIETTRRMYELIHRPDRFTVTQDGGARVATRGDLVMGSFDTLDRTQIAARVVHAQDSLVVLDEEVEMLDGIDYAIRLRQFADAEDVIGTSVLADVRGVAGVTRSLTLLPGAPLPAVGELVHFGVKASESLALRVRGIEPAAGFSSVLHMVAAAPIIDELMDAYVPSAWNGIVGSEIDLDAIVPPAPVFSRILSGEDPDTAPEIVQYRLSVGGGSAVVVSVFEIDHRLAGAGSWATDVIPVATGGGAIDVYALDADIEIRARSMAEDGTGGAWTAILPLTVGAGAVALPQALDDTAIMVAGGLGHARLTVAIPDDPAIAEIRYYRVPAGDALDRSLHFAGDFDVSALSTVEHVDGDATRANLLADPDFDTGADWTADASWTIAAGTATHSTGAAGTLSQPVALISGQVYRLGCTVAGATAGSVTPYLTGGSDRLGSAIATNGQALDKVQAVTGNDTFELRATSAFPGRIEAVSLFQETASCIGQGAWDYYLEPVNASGAAGPVSGALAVIIV